ncbi:hypothetical protein SAMN05444413_1237 [Roseivivax marinus]|nr:hypothetical protein SAMN05444413_1237 [Roseivivax marinus]
MCHDLLPCCKTQRGRLAAKRPGPVARIVLIDADPLAALDPTHQLSGLLGHPSRRRHMPPTHRAAGIGPAISRVDDVGVGIPLVSARASGRMRVDASELIARQSDCTRHENIDFEPAEMRVRRRENRRSRGARHAGIGHLDQQSQGTTHGSRSRTNACIKCPNVELIRAEAQDARPVARPERQSVDIRTDERWRAEQNFRRGIPPSDHRSTIDLFPNAHVQEITDRARGRSALIF